ncbi:MAG: MMPL family transporter [Thermoproteaceae archaeon]|nr:MMPL family transporter [Thermoproteaceae archaeon]
MRGLLAAAAIVLAVYLYLAAHGPSALRVLAYNETELMPADAEFRVVESIVGPGGEPKAALVVMFGPGLEEKARNLSRLHPDALTAWSILDEAAREYAMRIDAALSNATGEFRSAAVRLAGESKRLCDELDRLARAYNDALSAARRLLAGTYGVAALRNATDETAARFLEAYERYARQFDADAAVKLAADEVYGNVSRYLANVTWRDWASPSAVESVARAILGGRLNETAISLARNVSAIGVRQYVYAALVDRVPPALRPYLPHVICGGDVELAVSEFKHALLRNITERHPPPTLESLAAARSLVYDDRYAVALVSRGAASSIPESLGVPVSARHIYEDMRRIIAEDVPKIDKTTAGVLFGVVLCVAGSLLAPLVIVLLASLTYFAALGLLYHLSAAMKIYYLAAYTIAPVVFAVSVDYMLLMLGRYAEERARGRGREEAVAVVRERVSRAIAASAAVVAASLGSFAASRAPLMQSLGASYIIAAALVSLTVFAAFPAVLYLLGDKVFWPGRLSALHAGRSRLMERAVAVALRRPVLVIALSAALTAACAAYLLLAVRITTDYIAMLPETPHKRALEVALTYFPNVSSVSETYIAVRGPPPPALLSELQRIPHVVNTTVESRGEWHVISLKLSIPGSSDEQLEVYRRLDELRQSHGPFLVGGSASVKSALFNEVYARFWSLQVYIVIALVFAILALLLRSLIVPLRLLATVLMSASWSLAAGVAVFQWLLGAPLYWLVPVILFSFLVAIGTDYDVFIVSRVREEVERGLGDREAIETAVVRTGPVITGAALVLAAAFGALLVSQLTLLRQVGLTIALAALVDAFAVRPLVVPAVMTLAGRYNWLWPLRRGVRRRPSPPRAASRPAGIARANFAGAAERGYRLFCRRYNI